MFTYHPEFIILFFMFWTLFLYQYVHSATRVNFIDKTFPFDFELNSTGHMWRLSLWYIKQYISFSFFILHLITLEYSRAKFYSSRPSIWNVTYYPSDYFIILNLIILFTLVVNTSWNKKKSVYPSQVMFFHDVRMWIDKHPLYLSHK
jgi:hypothetical protein